MADPNNKIPSNVPGSYYVDYDCIDCDLCRETAPTVFGRDDDLGYSRVQRQPENADEVALAEEALAACPTAAIGKDVTSAVTPAA
jgi:ferredoxin